MYSTTSDVYRVITSLCRYVREWLGCMVSTKIVSLDAQDRYFIPELLKPALKKALEFAFFSPVVGVLTDKVIECYKEDGPQGFGYEGLPTKVIEAVENKTSDPDTAVDELIKHLPKTLEPNAVILDLGCGGGIITRALQRRLPKAVITATDYNQDAITKAEKQSKIAGVKYVKEDATKLPADWKHKFDWVILYDVLHDLPEPDKVMKEIRRVLKDDGFASIVDPDLHSSHASNIGDVGIAGVGYAVSALICLPCSLSVEGAAGHGMGWGTENKEEFLIKSGWKVVKKSKIQKSKFALNFTCVKV
ncbi:uncharacterized protein LOC117343628 isoform X2 [Pecten maximus]|uniref:uncharacterized protein LOC117343628 isoform X2 n=1 Tax=Pecten maximus TaxID=6579 RepID=UPI001458296A|nr:uncharacterized protein LOC117343628 isoform X2 [Pecten maximus]